MKLTLDVSSEGQINFPPALLRKVGIEPGAFVDLVEQDGQLVILPSLIEMYSDEDIARWGKENEWKPGEKELWKKRFGIDLP